MRQPKVPNTYPRRYQPYAVVTPGLRHRNWQSLCFHLCHSSFPEAPSKKLTACAFVDTDKGKNLQVWVMPCRRQIFFGKNFQSVQKVDVLVDFFWVFFRARPKIGRSGHTTAAPWLEGATKPPPTFILSRRVAPVGFFCKVQISINLCEFSWPCSVA